MIDQEKAMKAATRYLELRGLEDVKEANGWLTAFDPETEEQVIIKVDVCLDGFDHELPAREEFEEAAPALLALIDKFNMSLRFDWCQLLVVGADRAMVRHAIDVY